MKLSSYTAINASAGSGKTYALVQRILMICLAQPYKSDSIKNILALTFTNKAANEMKKRLIEWLESFTKENYAENQDLINIRENLKKSGINVNIEDLHFRAKNVLNYILHHYSMLNISTIDKFNSKLVRSFSYELGLPHQFNLEIQSEPYLIEAVDRLLDEIGNDDQISGAFMDLVDYNFENEERVNISQTLYNKAKTYINDVHYGELKKNENFDWNAYETTKNNIRKKLGENKKEAKKIAENARDKIRNNGLEIKDFSGGKTSGLGAFFDKYLDFINGNRDTFPFPTNEEKALINFRKGASSSCKDKFAVENMVEDLISDRENIIKLYISNIKNEKILKELLPFKFNKEIQDLLQTIENENDLVLLSKFNIIINENLKNEPSEFLYEKIGNRFQHFFIDEFQDTSKMQWENMLPLKDNNVSQEGNTFTIVGDPKQSIYRFRGGESEIMLDIINGKETGNVEVAVETLENNWRSAKNIVEFNNELYDFIGQDLEPEHKKLFSVDGKQNPIKKFAGRVRVNLSEYDRSTEPFFENSAEQMHRDIQHCVDLGFSLSDITIICRTGREIKEYSSRLGQKQILYKSENQNIKTISEKGLTLGISYTLKALMEFLRWKLEPKNHQFVVKFLYYLNELGRIKIDDFTQEITEILAEENIENALEHRYHFGLNIGLHLNLYNFVEHFVRAFSVEGKEVDFLLNFLENLYAFTQNAGATLKDFIKYWEEEAQHISVQASDNIDAVKLMTIHAAKGLEFPVVLLPMQNSNKDGQFSQWFNVENDGLKSINISNFPEEITRYDEEIADFNNVNQYKNLIDRLCVLYVATTRPVEHLYLYLQRPSKSGNPTEILRFIESKMGGNLPEKNEFDIYPNSDEEWKKISKAKEKEYEPVAIKTLSHNKKNLDNITIATPSKNYQNTKEKVREGILTHEILAKIKTENDIEKVLNFYLLEGMITQDESQNIKERILKILNDERYSLYFQEGLEVLSEREILFEGKSYRPDRLVRLSEGWVVIDFKTGKENEKYTAQVEQYKTILEKLGMSVCKTEIIYI